MFVEGLPRAAVPRRDARTRSCCRRFGADRADAALPDGPDDQLLLRERRQHRVRRAARTTATIFGDSEFWQSIINNILWLLIVPAVTVVFGVDRRRARRQAVDQRARRSPRASSSCRWRSRSSAPRRSGRWSTPTTPRASRPDRSAQRHLAAARRRAADLARRSPTLRLNSLLLMVILIWLQVGFAMILLSSAIKGVPEETLEAARIDGATELQIFFRVVIPQIKGTIITVFITVRDPGAQGLRHRLRADQRPRQDQRDREPVLHRAVPRQPGRAARRRSWWCC